MQHKTGSYMTRLSKDTPPTHPHQTASMITALDLDFLTMVTDGDPALQREILALFQTSAQNCLTSLTEYCHNGTGMDDLVHEFGGETPGVTSSSSWRGVAHNLKGAARAVGALRLAELAEGAETLPQGAERQELLQDIAFLIAETNYCISQYLGKLETTSEQSGTQDV